jgi:hypothetical protein
MLTIALSFKIFGISEFSARIPSAIVFIIGIIAIYLLAKKMSNLWGGIVGAFLYTFSHLNLAYATQAKPYSALETIVLVVMLLLIKSQEIKSRKAVWCHAGIIILLSLASGLHLIGGMLWVLYFGFITAGVKVMNLKKLLPPVFAVLFITVGILLAFDIRVVPEGIFRFNHLYQVVKLLAYKYTLVSLFSGLGFLWMFKKNRRLSYAVFAYACVVLLLATFQQYIFNIRYVVSLFGILYLYFGIFWAKVGEYYLPKKAWLIPLLMIVVLYVTSYKIVRTPRVYYNPNIDKYGDVQIANYREFYAKLKQRFPNFMKMYIISNIFDTEAWYMGRYSNAYFWKFTTTPYKHHTAGVYIYGTVKDFRTLIAKHPQGLLIMEDWQSFLPDDVKEYAKKNLKLEFRVESLKEAKDDPWPLALYSWGL